MGRVLPGEGDTPVHLDAVGCGLHIGVSAREGGEAHGLVDLIRSFREARRGEARRGDRRFGFEQEVRGHVLDRLEAADVPAELDACLGVFDGEVEDPARAADLEAGEGDEGEVEGVLERGLDRARGFDALGGARVEVDAREPERVVEGRQRFDANAGRRRIDLEDSEAGVRSSDDQEDVGVLAMDDVATATLERPGVPRPRARRRAGASRAAAR